MRKGEAMPLVMRTLRKLGGWRRGHEVVKALHGRVGEHMVRTCLHVARSRKLVLMRAVPKGDYTEWKSMEGE